jgi:FemAB-related protein (PEP-CTERM system-associated)
MLATQEIRVYLAEEKRDYSLWNSFVGRNPFSTPYHKWEFGQALSSTYKYEKYNFIAINGRQLLGIFPLLYIRSPLFGNKLISLPFCEYGGPLVDPNCVFWAPVVVALFKEVLSLSKRLNVDYIEIRNPLPKFKVLEKQGCISSKRYVTFEINLNQDKDLWLLLDKKTRNCTRKAMRSKINIYEVSKKNHLQDYFSLYLETQKRHGSPPHDVKLFQKLFCHNSNIKTKILIAEYAERPIAGISVFYDNTRIYWWGGVSNSRLKYLNATNVLLWKMIEWGHENGLRTFNLGRTRLRTGIYHFKKGWGGVEIPLSDYFYLVRSKNIHSPDPSEGKYQILTKLWSHVPIVLAQSIGPMIVKQVGL